MTPTNGRNELTSHLRRLPACMPDTPRTSQCSFQRDQASPTISAHYVARSHNATRNKRDEWARSDLELFEWDRLDDIVLRTKSYADTIHYNEFEL